jgi:tetratricopeptide (TPR) repeat protein
MKKASALAKVMLLLPLKDPAAPNPIAEIKQKADEQIGKIPSLRYRTEGEALFTQKKYEEALVKFKEALQTDPNDADLYSYLAVASANLQKFDDASQAIEKAIQMKPAEKAFVDTREKIKAMQLNASLAQAQKVLQEGDGLYKTQDYTGALKRYETALPMITGPKQAVVYAAIARSQAELNNSDKAIEAYRKAMELNPEGQEYRNALAQYYLKLKKYEDALNLYTDAKGAGGQSADKALFDLGRKQSDQGNNEVAALAFERAIKANPDNAEAYYELGMLLYFDKTNDARSSELLTKYVEIGKNTDHVNNTKNVLGVLKRRMAPKK